ncbi:carbohydrate-binding family 9-like protein [Bacillus sp. FJAT-28004]|uniref:carbohydrate-binding family 9-like protein n=1 Tax=Bacillus sp. FJAT-28004 TaxID=1679165 RepID=UPI0009E97F33|nr:carbohydrate-binding family 9-like protein [Bacillus sp. FJAT-28004]
MEAAAFQESKTYLCRQLPSSLEDADFGTIHWDSFDAIELVDTVTGNQPKERTEVRACWSPKYLHIRYLCEDSHVVSDFTLRDEPLYEQDVVELFIDEDGTGNRYLELEVSPNNIVFDALIASDGEATITATDLAWRFEGLQTAALADGEARRVYFVHIPVGNFKRPFEQGLSWRVNFYRIDEDRLGNREYQAWQATKAVNFHLPRKFGRLLFI